MISFGVDALVLRDLVDLAFQTEHDSWRCLSPRCARRCSASCRAKSAARDVVDPVCARHLVERDLERRSVDAHAARSPPSKLSSTSAKAAPPVERPRASRALTSEPHAAAKSRSRASTRSSPGDDTSSRYARSIASSASSCVPTSRDTSAQRSIGTRPSPCRRVDRDPHQPRRAAAAHVDVDELVAVRPPRSARSVRAARAGCRGTPCCKTSFCPRSGPKKTKSGRSAAFQLGNPDQLRAPRLRPRPAPCRHSVDLAPPGWAQREHRDRGRTGSRARLRFVSPRNLSKIGDAAIAGPALRAFARPTAHAEEHWRLAPPRDEAGLSRARDARHSPAALASRVPQSGRRVRRARCCTGLRDARAVPLCAATRSRSAWRPGLRRDPGRQLGRGGKRDHQRHLRGDDELRHRDLPDGG